VSAPGTGPAGPGIAGQDTAARLATVRHLARHQIMGLAFSMLVGIVFISVLFALHRAGLGVLRAEPAYVAASVAGAALLYVMMIYLVLPWANPLMCHMTPRGPFLIGQPIYGLIFGLVADPLARRRGALGHVSEPRRHRAAGGSRPIAGRPSSGWRRTSQ
jgi:hypothetical protein